MNVKKINKFLVKAKINTYALSGENGEKILSDSSKEFKFKEKEFNYRDRYFGFNPFLGAEVIYYQGEVIWGMNYYGKVISDVVSPKEVYSFLKSALMKIEEIKPFRGPDYFKEGNFEYINKVKGSVGMFIGEEKILYKKQEVYKLDYQGGFIN